MASEQLRYPEVWRGEFEGKTYRIRTFSPVDAFVEEYDESLNPPWNDYVEDDVCAGVYMRAFLETRARLQYYTDKVIAKINGDK